MSRAVVPGGFAILRQRDFSLYICTRLFAALAAQMIVIAVGWQVYHLTGRVLDLGLIGLSQFLPFLCLALFAGHAADRYDRRIIILICLLGYLACALLLFMFARARIVTVLPIFAALALLGAARAFLQPASQAFLPNIVSADSLGPAVAINSSIFQAAIIAGPSLGGFIYAVGEAAPHNGGGAASVYAWAASMLAAALCLLLFVKSRHTAYNRVAASWSSLLEGVRFTWRRKTVLGAISLDLFAVLFGGAAALLPAFTTDVLHAGPQVFGYLRAAPGLGAVATAIWLAFKPIKRAVGFHMFGGVAVFGVATVVFGLTQRFWVALTALILMGSGDMVSVFIRSLLVQLETPDEIRGRVSAVNAIAIGASNELGEFESGTTAAWFGLVPAIVLGGGVTLLVTLLWAGVFFPALWRLRSFEQLKDHRPNGTPGT